MYTHSKEGQEGLKNILHELIKIFFKVDAHDLHVFVYLKVRDKLFLASTKFLASTHHAERPSQ